MPGLWMGETVVTLIDRLPTRREKAAIAGNAAPKTAPMADGKRCAAYVQQNGRTSASPRPLTPRQRRRADKKLHAWMDTHA